MSKVKKLSKILFREGPIGTIKAFGEYGKKKKREQEFCRIAKTMHLISPDEREKQISTTFSRPVKFSIITPLYNTPKDYLIELLESLKKQTYYNWELCLADGSDKDHSYVGEICKKWREEDPRIVYSVLEENSGISGNTNMCIQLATGDYYGLLDHDDILHESALFEMMKVIEETNADFIYTDEVKFADKIEDAVDFNFKPAFGKDELRSHNYICHFTVFSKRLLEKEQTFYRPEFDGSQDHDMVLRLTEKAERIVHIPKVLYYWRVHPQSVSMNLDAKSYAVDAAIRAVSEQLKRGKEQGKVASNLPYQTIYRVRYEIQGTPKVSILVQGEYDEARKSKIKEQIIQNTEYGNYEIEFLMQEEKEILGSCVNRFVRESSAEYFVLLNGNCSPKNKEWLTELLMLAQRRDVCAVSPKVTYENNRICFAGFALDAHVQSKICRVAWNQDNAEQGYEAMLRYVRNTTAVWSGCCMFSKHSWTVLEAFDEKMSGYEVVDFSLKGTEKGLWNVWTCFSEMTYEGQELLENNHDYVHAFEQKWSRLIDAGDKYYHPALKKLGLL